MATEQSASSEDTSASGGMFVRRATGLTRDIGFLHQIWINLSPAAPGAGLALTVFIVLGAYPGGHLVVAFFLTAIIGFAIIVPYALLSMIVPRTGADYMLVSRVLGPAFGLASSFSLVMFQFLGLAFLAIAFVTVGLVPVFATIGTITHHPSFLHTATTMSQHGWTVALTVAILLVCAAMGSVRNRIAMRVLTVTFFVSYVGLIAAVIVMFATSRSGFIHIFNSTVGAGAYSKLINAAHVPALNTSWSATVAAIGDLSAVYLFCWWTTAYGGEIRGARTWRNLGSMTIAIGAITVTFAVVTLALIHMVGGGFVTSANAVYGTPAYTLSIPPFWVTLAAIGANSSPLGVFLLITYLFWFIMIVFINLMLPTRVLFAWAFDGLLPQKTAYVSPRQHAPLVTLWLTMVLTIICVVVEVYTTSFNSILALLVLLFLVPPASVAWSLALLPWLRPQYWKQSPIRAKIAGVPVITLIGLLSFALCCFEFWIFVHYRALGLHNHLAKVVELIVGFYVGGFVLYYVVKGVQARRGVNIALNYAEIPPE